jgi:hypothetical protein
MTMANLIKRIAVSSSRRNGQASMADEFKSSGDITTSGAAKTHSKRISAHELASIVSYTTTSAEGKARAISFTPVGNQIKTTQEITVTSEPNHFVRRGSEVEITGNYATKLDVPRVIEEETRRSSLDSSVKSAEVVKRGNGNEESDDEAALVGRRWGNGEYDTT